MQEMLYCEQEECSLYLLKNVLPVSENYLLNWATEGKNSSNSLQNSFDAKPKYFKTKNCSVADPAPGSGAFLTHGSGIRNRFFPDPKPIFL
jgi:hypothetical protein